MKHSQRRLWFTIVSAALLPICILASTLSTHDEAATIYNERINLSVASTSIISEIPNFDFFQNTTTEYTSEISIENPTEAITSVKKSSPKITVTTAAPKIEETTEAPTSVEDTTSLEVSVTEVITEEATTEEITESHEVFYSMSDSELKMFAKLLYLEAGNASYKCQLGVASVVMNLMLSEGISLKSCIYTPGRFSVANQVSGSTYSDSCMKAAKEICTNGPIFPRNVKCFRNNHYFSWATPYTHIDNVYFSSY